MVSQAAELLLLDRPQQLDLHRQRQIAHLVEEQGAAVGRLENLPVGIGTGEAPFLAPKNSLSIRFSGIARS